MVRSRSANSRYGLEREDGTAFDRDQGDLRGCRTPGAFGPTLISKRSAPSLEKSRILAICVKTIQPVLEADLTFLTYTGHSIQSQVVDYDSLPLLAERRPRLKNPIFGLASLEPVS